jgi:hypothetical protein
LFLRIRLIVLYKKFKGFDRPKNLFTIKPKYSFEVVRCCVPEFAVFLIPVAQAFQPVLK